MADNQTAISGWYMYTSRAKSADVHLAAVRQGLTCPAVQVVDADPGFREFAHPLP